MFFLAPEKDFLKPSFAGLVLESHPSSPGKGWFVSGVSICTLQLGHVGESYNLEGVFAYESIFIFQFFFSYQSWVTFCVFGDLPLCQTLTPPWRGCCNLGT